MELKRNYPLVISSSLFLIPGTYVLIYKNSVYSILTYSISIASINYWLDPSNNNKLFYDKCTSFTGSFLYIINSLYYLPTIKLKSFAVTSVFLYYLVYLLSCNLYKNNNNKWIYAHFFMHLLVFTSKWILYLNI